MKDPFDFLCNKTDLQSFRVLPGNSIQWTHAAKRTNPHITKWDPDAGLVHLSGRMAQRELNHAALLFNQATLCML